MQGFEKRLEIHSMEVEGNDIVILENEGKTEEGRAKTKRFQRMNERNRIALKKKTQSKTNIEIIGKTKFKLIDELIEEEKQGKEAKKIKEDTKVYAGQFQDQAVGTGVRKSSNHQ